LSLNGSGQNRQRHSREIHFLRLTALQVMQVPTSNERQALRRTYRRKRRSLGRQRQAQNSLAVCRHFFSSRLALSASTIALYFANDGEVDLEPLLGRLLRAGKRIALPVVRQAPGRAAVLEFYRYQADTRLVTNRYDIPEPAAGAAFVPAISLDLVLVPLVAFDDQGTRLGMGAGFYDRFFAGVIPALRPNIIGVAHEIQRSARALPAASWDIPLQGVITEDGWQALPPGRS